LVDGGLVVQGSDDKCAVDCAAAAGGIFEHAFGLGEVDERLVEELLGGAVAACEVELVDFGGEEV
jgi:hypothetical protein